ncbi:MAG: (d)CMP kinase [Clostridiaceae bacterium]|nr:(d)CMP kinase [Clostridiaceae bacterium]
MQTIAVAIDGPSGAGKSTLARAVAQEFGFLYVDTGALYRTVGLFVRRKEVDPDDAAAVARILPEAQVSLAYRGGEQRALLNGEDVSDAIRTPEASRYASKVSAHPVVREFLLDTQRRLAREQSVVMDGRDIGTVVLPDAQVKLFLHASAEDRARRRMLELSQRGMPQPYEEVLADIRERDERDAGRTAAPLKKAPDAIDLDTTGNTLKKSRMLLIETVKGKIRECGIELYE